jgi:TetR/AcrR family transcriptional regulator, mexCD-oprJ operon repressor
VTRAALKSIEDAKPDEGDPVEALERVITVAWDELERQEAIRQAAAEELSSEAVRRAHETAAGTVQRLIQRGRAEGAFRRDLPVQWLVASCFALLHTAADEVRGNRLKPDQAMSAVKTSLIELFTGRRPQ